MLLLLCLKPRQLSHGVSVVGALGLLVERV